MSDVARLGAASHSAVVHTVDDLCEVSLQNADIREHIERRVASVDELAQLP